jgi:hypothetical protein
VFYLVCVSYVCVDLDPLVLLGERGLFAVAGVAHDPDWW